MSALERRVQLLLEQERFDRIAERALLTGSSVNAVIRDAIDLLSTIPTDKPRRWSGCLSTQQRRTG